MKNLIAQKKRAIMFTFLTIGMLVVFSGTASAHIWQIGWNGNVDGSLDFYGVSYHVSVQDQTPGSNTVDDFFSRPAGLVINGTNVTFDFGSVVDLNDCFGAGGTSGTCSPTWNGLGLDGFLTANGFATDIYGKYASVNLTTAELSALGISTGVNSVTLTSFADNVDWAGLTFDSATVPIQIIVPPASNPVPEPATMVLFGLGLSGIAAVRRKKYTK